jgi:Flp pilus assembly secretin CpaC
MKPGICRLVVATMLLFAAIPGARAGEDDVALGIGDAFRLFLEKDYASVIVGDPLVVDIRTDDNRSVLIEPLSAGQTNLIFVDARGIVIANVRISVCGAPPSNGCMVRHSS